MHVATHRLFGRSADNLTLTVPVTFSEAALGGEVKVPTLAGTPVTLKIPPGTANGRTFRVKGKGVPRKDGTRATCSSRSRSSSPASSSDAAREAVEAFRDATAGEDPRAGLLPPARRAPDMPFTAGRDGAWESDDTTPVFVISVAAELTGLHAQTLRQYDRLGLVSPGRTPGGGRRYSRRDIASCARSSGCPASVSAWRGSGSVLELANHVAALQARVRELEAELDAYRERDRRTALALWRPTHPTRR